jgi:hypothetical protein
MVIHWRPVLILALIAPLLTELLSTNVTLLQFVVQPWLYPYFATLGYGIPVLLIRETALRWRLGAPGLCALGLIYGIYNEGLWAKTFLLTQHMPVHEFEGYGVIAGIALPWALTISLWHALYAVVFPLTIVVYLCPKDRELPWLGRKTYYALLALIADLAMLPFFAAGKPPQGAPAGTVTQLGLYVAVSAALVLAAVALVVPIFLAQKKVAPGGFYLYMAAAAALVFLLLHVIKGRKSRMIFSLGGILGMALFVLVIGAASGSIDRCVSSAAFIVWAVVAIARVVRQKQAAQPG